MIIIKQYKRNIGSKKATKNAPIRGAVIVKGNPNSIEKMNRILRKKCETQRKNDAMTTMIAANSYAGD